MIEHDDTPTAPHPTPAPAGEVVDDNPTTIQIPVAPIELNEQTTPTEPAKPTASTGLAEQPVHPVQPVAMPTVTPIPAANPPMSVIDLLSLRIASDPQLSPDGSTIAYVVQECHEKTNTTSSAIWLVNSSGGKTAAPRKLTAGTQHDTAPRWSPDGKTLAFLSDREGTAQVYLLSLDGGEARTFSALSQGITEYSWRPDGSALLAHSAWKPADERSEAATGPLAIVYTRVAEQWDGLGYREGRSQQLWLLPLAGEPLRITSEPVDLVQSCWSPDGTEIAFCANRRPDPDLSVSMALWVLTLANGQMRRLSPEDGLAQMPVWSPDGQHIAYYFTADQTEAENSSPWIVNAYGEAAPRPATNKSLEFTSQQLVVDELRNESFTPPCWFPDGQSLLIPIQERGQVHLYRADSVQQQLVKLTSGNGRYLDAKISKDGQIITLVRADWFTPGDIWSMDGQGKNVRKLTGVNDALLRGRQLIRPKRISWHSFDGLEIGGWLYLPPLGEQQKAPLILEVHGGPSLAWGDAYVHEFQVLAGQGYAVLAANPRGSAGYGEDFCVKVVNDWGGDDFRDLMAGIDHVIATEAVDGDRLGIGGLSYGGYMTNWAVTQTDRFKAGVSRNGISNLTTSGLLTDQVLWFELVTAGSGEDGQDVAAYHRNRSPLTFADKITAPLLLLHSEQDMRCPIEESVQLFIALRMRKHKVELVRYPNMSHLIDWPDSGTPLQRTDRLRRTLQWFQHFV
ncbi:MAG TPA: prolyl oligopeptidase family serine peptidase [Ktedonobacteraceae bacterium]|nr:prolyl oligopeptidase family serine peptidase [Ktedonobacteraceae bacterium]